MSGWFEKLQMPHPHFCGMVCQISATTTDSALQSAAQVSLYSALRDVRPLNFSLPMFQGRETCWGHEVFSEDARGMAMAVMIHSLDIASKSNWPVPLHSHACGRSSQRLRPRRRNGIMHT